MDQLWPYPPFLLFLFFSFHFDLWNVNNIVGGNGYYVDDGRPLFGFSIIIHEISNF